MNAQPHLKFKPGFWPRIAWGKPDSERRGLCALCHCKLAGDGALMLFKKDGSLAEFCNDCVNKWLEQ